MVVVIKGVPVELPEPEATLLLQRGLAHLPELSVTDPRTRAESSGTQTPRGHQQGTGSKPRKPSQGSRKKGTK